MYYILYHLRFTKHDKILCNLRSFSQVDYYTYAHKIIYDKYNFVINVLLIVLMK